MTTPSDITAQANLLQEVIDNYLKDAQEAESLDHKQARAIGAKFRDHVEKIKRLAREME